MKGLGIVVLFVVFLLQFNERSWATCSGCCWCNNNGDGWYCVEGGGSGWLFCEGGGASACITHDPCAVGGCFLGGVMVTIDGGEVPIEDLTVGDRVLSLDEDSKASGAQSNLNPLALTFPSKRSIFCSSITIEMRMNSLECDPKAAPGDTITPVALKNSFANSAASS